MALDFPQYTLFFYRDSDIESYNIAKLYQEIHNLNNNQLIPLTCTTTEILADYSTFQTQIENDVLSAINAYGSPIYVLVLGYNVPGGFYDGIDIISSTSRLSRINDSFTKQKRSFLYNRKIFKNYDATDGNYALITGRVDGPTPEIVRDMLRYSKEGINQSYINGILYFDPYSNNTDNGYEDYNTDLQYFYSNLLYDLGIEVSSTVLPSEYEYSDIVVPYLHHDSFYWGWFNNETTSSYFENTDTARIFFYNADYSGGVTVRSTSNNRFMPLAIEAGYISVAGAMSDPTIDGFLRPYPFFYALKNNSILGEAFLFACPYLDWTVSFVGDPLFKANFKENRKINIF